MDEIELYRLMLTKDPASHVFLYLAEALMERGMYTEAIETCTSGLRLHPHDLRSRVILGFSCLRNGDLDRAETELLKAKKMLEINAVIYEALAELYERKGLTENAAFFRKRYQALHSEEDSEPAKSPTAPPPEQEEVATVTMAELYLQQGHLEKAATVYRKILETAPETPGIEERLAELQKKIGAPRRRKRLINALEGWLGNIHERARARTTVRDESPPELDPEELASFLRRWTQETRSPGAGTTVGR